MSYKVWKADFDRFSAALAPFVIDIDGEQFIGLDAPAALSGPFTELAAFGYLNGWME